MILMKNITKSFNSSSVPALDELNLSLQPGDFCVVIGANGSGKSTLLKTINGDHIPDSGVLECQAQIAQVVQDVNLGTIPEMSLFENIALSQIKRPKLFFYKRYRKEVMKKIAELAIGLEQYIDQPLQSLSGGQRQMIATLMAINSGHKILLLDEHTSALDPKMEKLLMEYTAKQISKHKITTVMITHKMDDAIKYGNRLVMMHKGKIVFDIAGNDKKKLNTLDLLALFHKYEDQTLLSGGSYDN